MNKRVLEIASSGYLSTRHQQLLFENSDGETKTVPIEDLGVLVLANESICMTQALLGRCAEYGVSVLFCDRKYMPAAIMLPVEGHHLHASTLRSQIALSRPKAKRLWSCIVKAKIAAQTGLIAEIGGAAPSVGHFIDKVQSGDSTNVEAQAARAYWKELFGKEFRRDRDQFGINSLLNYGYAVLRSLVSRAVVGCGMHPALGLMHSSQYNSFALADDLLEPFRPAVDYRVWRIAEKYDDLAVDTVLKRELYEVLNAFCAVDDKKVPITVAVQYFAAAVRDVICGDRKIMRPPMVLFEASA